MIFAVSGVQGQAKTKKTEQVEWHPAHPPSPPPSVYFQYDLTLDLSASPRIHWFDGSPLTDTSPVKNLLAATPAVMERITGGRSASFPSFTPLSPGEERWVSAVHRCGTRQAVCGQKSSPAVIKCVSVFFPLLQPEVLSLAGLPPASLVPGDKRVCYQAVAPTDAYVHTQSAYCEQALTNSAGSLLLLSCYSCLHPASASRLLSLFTAPLWTEFQQFLSFCYIHNCWKVSGGRFERVFTDDHDLGSNPDVRPWWGH